MIPYRNRGIACSRNDSPRKSKAVHIIELIIACIIIIGILLGLVQLLRFFAHTDSPPDDPTI